MINRIFKDKLNEVNVLSRVAGGMSDHFLGEEKFKVKTRYWGGRKDGERMRTGGKQGSKRRFQEKIKEK